MTGAAAYSNVRTLLLDADGSLFPSEDLAYGASMQATNALLAELGILRRYTAAELRRDHTGRNFRATAPLLTAENGVDLDPAVLERWVAIERDIVTRHLARSLRPDAAVAEPVRRLAATVPLAVVSSSATARVRACLRATGLSDLFAVDRLFSAEDSLDRPVSKPDPAVYRWAGEQLGVSGPEALAVEDSEVGVQAAVAAGFPVIGLLQFVPSAEAGTHAEVLRAAGATAVVDAWADLVDLLLPVLPSLPVAAR